MHNFSVWLKTGSNPPDINRFVSGTKKLVTVPGLDPELPV